MLPWTEAVAELIPERLLVLQGSHHFSDYALSFRLEPLGAVRTRVIAETRAVFPGLKGRAYRALVIGTRMHVLVVRRVLREQVRQHLGPSRPGSRRCGSPAAPARAAPAMPAAAAPSR